MVQLPRSGRGPGLFANGLSWGRWVSEFHGTWSPYIYEVSETRPRKGRPRGFPRIDSDQSVIVSLEPVDVSPRWNRFRTTVSINTYRSGSSDFSVAAGPAHP
jgi:hypothetical protein